ncbi:MAG: hypothetical protein AABX10_00355 [Nanoarchaeota archaeon]|mgnify:FL=1
MKKEMMDKETKHHDNSSGVVGIIFGIMSILSGAPGILLGLIGFFFSLNQNKKAKNNWSKWGMVLNVVGFVLGIIFAVYISVYLSNAVAGLQGIPG